MGLFSIFKKKAEQEVVVVPTDGIKGLVDGILFEDERVLLKWGGDIEADKLYAKKEFRADRVIYQWGERTILNGLKLPFKTVCWYQKQHGNTRSFENIEFLLQGNEAGNSFQSIRNHVEGVFGEPKQPEDLNPGEVFLEWRIKAVKVSLKFFNKEQPEVHFEAGWWL